MKNEIVVKGRICSRCLAVLQKELDKQGLVMQEISRGKVAMECQLDEHVVPRLREVTLELGFELRLDKQAKLLSQIKEIVETQLTNTEERKMLSAVLAERLNVCYSSLNETFLQVEGLTIAQYYIQRRLELVKELLRYSDSTFTEIAFRTGFSSVHHLSKQFKDRTGLTPSQFRNQLKAGTGIGASTDSAPGNS